MSLLRRELLILPSHIQTSSSANHPCLRKRQHNPLTCLSQKSRDVPGSLSFIFLSAVEPSFTMHPNLFSSLRFFCSDSTTIKSRPPSVFVLALQYPPNRSPWFQTCPLFINPPEWPSKNIDQIKSSQSLKLSNDFPLHLEKNSKFLLLSHKILHDLPLPPTAFLTHLMPALSVQSLGSGQVGLVSVPQMCQAWSCAKAFAPAVPLPGMCFLHTFAWWSPLELSMMSPPQTICATYSLTILAPYFISLRSSYHLLMVFFFISLVTVCLTLWDSRNLSIHAVSCSDTGKARNKYCLNRKRKELQTTKSELKSLILGGVFILTESQNCLIEIWWCSEAHQVNGNEKSVGKFSTKPWTLF